MTHRSSPATGVRAVRSPGPLPEPSRGLAVPALAALLALALGSPAAAAPFVWDNDDNRVDDRIETVHVLGYTYSFEQADTLQRQRIEVARAGAALLYGVYVRYDHPPAESDIAALTALGMPVLHRFVEASALRSIATFAQASAAANLPGVERIESIPLLYPVVRDAAATLAVRDETGTVFPTWATAGGTEGEGVVVAILDTGVNDEPDGAYPGHESVRGRCVGGATFVGADSTLNTPRDGSVNPCDRGGTVTRSHGTHVAALVLGGPCDAPATRGLACAARFVDVKVLNDAGIGTSVAEALDWCIANRARDWGAGPAHAGIDVINMSLSSLDYSDGNDLASKLADRAAELGMVVVASMGNDGESGHVPSPAAGDRVIAVGAMDDQRSPGAADDGVPGFGNRGPRVSDGDAESLDELKPDLVAPGVAVLSADGDLASDGAAYQRLSGTSMSAALVSGAVAALRSSAPALTPVEIADLLRRTADRDLAAVAPGATGADPRWRSTIGYGRLDLHAARLELDQPARTQIVRLEIGATTTTIEAAAVTQRERGATHIVLERADDLGGAPDAFAAVDSAAAAGTAELDGFDHRERYGWSFVVPVSERGVAHWYRVAYTEDGVRHASAARRVASPAGPPAATIELTIVHNAYDHDLGGALVVGGSPGAALAGGGAPFSRPLPGTASAWRWDWVDGLASSGNLAWSFRVPVTTEEAGAFLPPSASAPWWIRVDEGGYVNRSGRITDYRVIWHGPSGDQVYAGGPVPQATVEGASIYASVPGGIVAVDDGPPAGSFRVGPNPARPGTAVSFTRPAARAGEVRVFDLGGREVGRAPFLAAGSEDRAVWVAVDRDGQPLPAGVYFASAGGHASTRLVLVPR